MTSSRMRLGLSWRSSAPVIASIVPGAIPCPWLTSSVSSRTTVSAVATSRSPPSSVSTLPRRKTSQSSPASSVFMIASPGPASSLATSFVTSSCVRIRCCSRRRMRRRAGGACAAGIPGACTRNLSGQLLLDSGAHALAVRTSFYARHHERHHLAHLLRRGRAALRDHVADDRVQLLVGQLLGEVGGNQVGLALFAFGAFLVAGGAVCVSRLQSPFALPLEYQELIRVAGLLRLLQLRADHPQHGHPLALARLHRGLALALHALE